MDLSHLTIVLVVLSVIVLAIYHNTRKVKTANTIFVTVECGCMGLLDYPEHLPIPNKGDYIVWREVSGTVTSVRYVISGTVTEIIITLTPE